MIPSVGRACTSGPREQLLCVASLTEKLYSKGVGDKYCEIALSLLINKGTYFKPVLIWNKKYYMEI